MKNDNVAKMKIIMAKIIIMKEKRNGVMKSVIMK